jgi:hypothetical protein
MKASSVFKNKSLIISLLLLVLILVLAAGFFLKPKNNIPSTSYVSTPNDFLSPVMDLQTDRSSESTVPVKFLIADFPFQSQAPLGVWDTLHDEACEEASIILINYFLSQEEISKEQMDQEILKTVLWQNKYWDKEEQYNLNLEETLLMAQENYDLKGNILSNANLETLKYEISQNRPVIVPTAGRLLGNPNFRSPGPVYHMVVAIGYDQNNIIVQDVGTRNGDHYKYNKEIFFNAWHDWVGSEDNIEQGPKNLLVLAN